MPEPDELTEAYRAARALRDEAESEAAEIRRAAEADADLTRVNTEREAAKRLHEIELYVAKAKRGLVAAEQRAGVILDTAKAEAERLLLAAQEEARAIAAGERSPDAPSEALRAARKDVDDLSSALDRLLAEALHKALGHESTDPYPKRGPGRTSP